jgi:hypothetical protein
VKVSDDLLDELQEWEESKQTYLQQMEPILSKKTNQLETLFNEYLSDLNRVMDTQKFSEEIKKEMIEEETKKFKSITQQLFGKDNASLKIMDKEIATRKNVLKLEKHIIKIQSVWRGYIVRKTYKRALKNHKQRNSLVKEILETEKVIVESTICVLKF